ncbi:hypothetical protein M409DRAFT_65135 [Zasmidium cellare ATCC 36951]|uniref:Inosine/uridine-preferring nucleoside hydrolase domain-containing protein n=1 Tax=Zasmidium cellare ATCC 36951 TaxID=1080233 RepID=A0A6A6CRD7_ZASCE|nr:uncharacterized protein M409DRAFT_65135 [Zasmidium cellare ATCC 36951]KAF2168700.1 hypothetical protein M409DRAFT_65135 [Zasmidium cellare ATCC 36951]
MTAFMGLARRQPIIIDTDLFGDVDDASALAVANVLHNCGLADLRGVAINTHSKYGAPAASAICSYFGNSHVAISAIRPLTNETFFDDWQYLRGEYASKVAYNWPGAVKDAFQTNTPVSMYRSILAAADSHSLHIISIGFLTNLADVLRSTADSISPLSGTQLLEAKVSELIVMGGQYPSGWEYNFGGGDPESTAYVLANWPRSVSITFSGNELGGNIYSGREVLERAPADSPVLAAYEWYVTRGSVTRETWDPVTTLYGIVGMRGFQKLGVAPLLRYGNRFGYNKIVSSNGSNAWINDTSVRNQHWLELGYGVQNTTMADLINNFLVHPPSVRICLV